MKLSRYRLYIMGTISMIGALLIITLGNDPALSLPFSVVGLLLVAVAGCLE